LLDQVNMIVNQNFLESPEDTRVQETPLETPSVNQANQRQIGVNPRPSQIPRMSQFHAPRLSTRESLIQGKNQVISTKFNQSGKLLSIIDARGYLYIIEVNTGCVVHKKYFQSKLSTLSWNGDRILAVGDSTGKLYLFSLDRGFANPLLSIQMHDSEIIKIAFSQNGSYVSTSGADKKVLALDLGRLRHHFYSLRGSFLQNLPELAMITKKDIINLTTLPSMSKALIFHPLNPRYLIVGGGVDDQKMRVFDIISKRLLIKVNAGSQVCSLGFDKEGSTLISSHGFSENVIKLWDLNVLTKRLVNVKVLNGHGERVLHLAVSPCGKFIVSGSGDETLRIWQCFEGEQAKKKGRSGRGNFMKRGISSMR
jgi:WD40 repeat protein